MSNASALVLLPPRHSAAAPAEPAVSKNNQPTAHTSFSHKLEKAKAVKSAVGKKQVAAAVPKPVVAAKVPAKPATPLPAKDEDQGSDSPADQNADEDGKPSQTGQNLSSAAKAGKTQTQSSGESPAVTKPVQQLPLPKSDAAKPKPDNNPSSQQNAKHRKDTNDPKAGVQEAADAAVQPNQVNLAVESTHSAAVPNSAPTESPVADSIDTDKSSQDAGRGSAKIVSTGAGDNSNASASDASNAAASSNSGTASAGGALANAMAQPAAVVADVTSKSDSSGGQSSADAADAAALGALSPAKTAVPLAGKVAATPAPSPQAAFAQENQPKIISSIQGQLLPNGGTMQIRLDPPELGALQVTVNMRNGVMSASFETTSDHATKLLSHSLGQLKSGLEAAGMHVEKLQVEQAPKQEAKSDSESDSESKQPPHEQQQQAQQDQQRRAMVQRMWRKLAGGDPLDLVA